MVKVRDVWEKADILSKIISAILIPVVLIVFGNQFTEQQKKLEYSIQQSENRANRLTVIVDQLSSENEKKRQLAIAVAEFLGKNDQLPKELVPVLIVIVSSDPNKEIAKEARQSLKNIAQNNPALAQTINQELANIPTLVYIQIANENQRDKARKIQSDLRQNQFSAPGIENVGDKKGIKAISPQNTEVRYFSVQDKNQATKIVEILKSNGVTSVPVHLQSEKTEPIEIWFSSSL